MAHRRACGALLSSRWNDSVKELLRTAAHDEAGVVGPRQVQGGGKRRRWSVMATVICRAATEERPARRQSPRSKRPTMLAESVGLPALRCRRSSNTIRSAIDTSAAGAHSTHALRTSVTKIGVRSRESSRAPRLPLPPGEQRRNVCQGRPD
jgi:hypothetical protein